MSKSEPEPIKLRVAFVGEDEPAVFVNHFALSIEREDLFMTMGQLIPPIITGPRETWAEQASRIPFVPIRIRGRYAMNVDRARELHRILGEQLAQHDARGQR